MKQKTDRKRGNAGITLIALIITVIVMLILAAVAINLTIGDNGIFKKSDEGAQIYRNVANNEATRLNEADTEMGSLFNQYYSENGGSTSTDNPTQTTEPTPTPSTPAEKPGKPDVDGIYTENSTINGGDDSAFNPEIPKGFKPVDIDDAVWGDGSTPPTEEAVQKGLVIEDEEGNQFVWIAVDGETVKLDRYTFAEDGTEAGHGEDAIANDGGSGTCQELENPVNGNAPARNLSVFKSSVSSHGGYYIARYEASYGADEKPNSKVSTGTPNNNDGVAYAPTQEGQLWNNITQPNAATACQNMYDSSYGVTSDLVNSCAWDTAIVFIQKYSGDTDYSRQSSLNTVSANTGVNRDEKCHIHDMASNCYEWTTETVSNAYYPCVVRGGFFNRSTYYTSVRYNYGTDHANRYCSFRVLLYL